VILYLDTSALVKIYLDEPGTARVKSAVAEAETTATSEITAVELCAALARRHRDGDISQTAYRRTLADIDEDAKHLMYLDVSRHLIRAAADAAAAYALRGYDALHLASALELQTRSGESITFGCWDATLMAAATKARLRTLSRD
jgi:uncharacterized protein with PIN domain